MFNLTNIHKVNPAWIKAARDGRYDRAVIKYYWYEPLKAFLDSPEWQLECARRYVSRQQARIRKCLGRHDFRGAVHQAHCLYKTNGAMLVAAARAIRNENRRIGSLTRRGKVSRSDQLPTPPQLAQMLADPSIDPDVCTWREAKRSGGFREMVSFHVVDRARQELVAIAFGTLVGFDPSQAGVGGKSYLAALDAAEVAVRDNEYKWVCELDLRNYFSSITIETLSRHYKVPRRVLEEVVTLIGKEKRGKIKDRRIYGSEGIRTNTPPL